MKSDTTNESDDERQKSLNDFFRRMDTLIGLLPGGEMKINFLDALDRMKVINAE